MLHHKPRSIDVTQQARLLEGESIVFRYGLNKLCRRWLKNIETCDMLGDITNEISGKRISSFASTGPKSYSFKYGDNEQKSAIKGFTLNHENNNLLNHDSLSKIVKKQIREITIVNENKITRKNREIVNKYCEKVFKFGYDKRVIKQINEDHIDTLPYGY